MTDGVWQCRLIESISKCMILSRGIYQYNYEYTYVKIVNITVNVCGRCCS